MAEILTAIFCFTLGQLPAILISLLEHDRGMAKSLALAWLLSISCAVMALLLSLVTHRAI